MFSLKEQRLSFRNRAGLTVLFDGDPVLFNPYGIILVNPDRHPHVKVAQAQSFIDWLLSDTGKAAIASFRVEGEQLFFPASTTDGPAPCAAR